MPELIAPEIAKNIQFRAFFVGFCGVSVCVFPTLILILIRNGNYYTKTPITQETHHKHKRGLSI